jgi:tetratricopeptide (TPR) repeat protein
MTKRSPKLTRLLCRLVVLPLAVTCFSGVALLNQAYPAPVATSRTSQGEAGYRHALELLKQDRTAEALPLLEAAWGANPNNTHMLADYLGALVWSGQYDKAISLYAVHKIELQEVKYLYRNMAKAYYESKDFRQAQLFYDRAFAFNQSDVEALKGLIFCAVKLQEYRDAVNGWLAAYQKKTIPPHTLEGLRVYLLQQAGAASLALSCAREAGIADKNLLELLKGDVAAERIKWEENDAALQILEQQLLDNPENFRARCDYVVALRNKFHMQEILKQYEIIKQAGRPAPYWVTESVADALLYLKQPQEAVRFYQLRLEQNPGVPFNAYMGLYSAYTELRAWDEADKTWDRIDALLEHRQVNFVQKHEAFETRGWYFLYQDKLREAQDYFNACLREAGLYSGFRAGLGQTYYFRGWSQQALQQFKIGRNVAPNDVETQVGEATVLNDLNYKYEARSLAAELYRKYPYDLHVQELYQNLQVEDMPMVTGDARVIKEWPGVTEYRFRSGVSATINPVFKVFSEVLHMHSYENSSGQKYAFSWDRVGLGFNWIVLPPLTLTQSVSSDYLKGRDLGSYTKVAWQASERLKASASFNSFSLDIPLRARATGVKGKTAVLDLGYHESDLRDYGLVFTSNWLSDGNYNPSVLLGFDQNVINNPNWKVRVGPQFYYGRYSKDPNVVPYFSPNFEYSLGLKPSLQIIHYNMYDKKIRSNIYAEVGLYKEQGFNFLPTAGIMYELEFRTSKTFWLKSTVGYYARVYDGSYTNALEAFLTINKKF